ncbi:MAG: hydrogenase maturation protease [Bacteroidales bacterium]|jgi:hydrogenase maturation protease|nr:hydrogenase maturation protease [Bacteroidales bacterium]
MKIIKKILILGIGNDILTDDGIGPRLVRDLAQMNINPNFGFDVAGCGGLEIMEHIKGYDKVIFIDAIRTRTGKPGAVYYFIPSDFRETSHLSNLHDLNFLTSLKLGEILELGLPSDLHIIAVEILEDMVFGEELTFPLKNEYPRILRKVVSLIKKIAEK